MAKWEIIEDIKFKKQAGGKAAATRTAAIARAAAAAAAKAKLVKMVPDPIFPTQDNTKINILNNERNTVYNPNAAKKPIEYPGVAVQDNTKVTIPNNEVGNKNALNPSYNVAKNITKAVVDHAIEQKNYDEAYKWTSDYMNSPMYKKMLIGSSANTREFNDINNARWSNFKSIPPLQILPQPEDDPNTGGQSWSNTGQIELFPMGFGTKGTGSHEISHSVDRPAIFNRVIPKSDINYIQKNKAKVLGDSRLYWNNLSIEQDPKYFKEFYSDYVGEDTETRARLNAIRQGAQQNKLYDPFKQKVTPELYYNKLKNFQFEKGDKSGFDPMEQLKGVYSDEEILYMLNHISENKKENDGTELDNLPKAQNGLVIEDPMGQWAHPGSVTRIPSNQITMQGVNYPVLGVSDRGHTQMMYPGEDYSFRGKSVTEYPMMQGGGQTLLRNQILNTKLPATNQPTLNPNFNRSTSTTSPLSLQVEGKKDYGVSLNKNGLNLSGGLNLEDKKPAFRAGIDYGKGNWSGNANYSTNNNNFETKVGYNNNGFSAGAGYQKNNDNNSFNANAGYSNSGFNVGAGYQRNNNNNSFNANVGYDGDSPVSFDANYAYDKGHSFDTNVGLNLGKFSGGLNYGYNQEEDKAHNFGANANLGLGKNLNLSADANFDSNKNYQVNAGLKYNFQDGGEVNFTYAGENHRVYEKESPTGNGKGIEGHIMVNHPTENKGKWDTIDLTKITNGKVKTVPQGVASTKKWHKENPEYANGGQVSSWEIIEDIPKAQTGILTPKDSLYHQRDKTIKYDLLRGGAQGNPLPQYSNTAYYNQFYKDSVEPKLKYYPTAMEKGDAGDFIFNTGKDPRVFAYQEYLRKTDPTNKTGWQDASGNWKDRKTLPFNFDSTYDNTIGKFSENERRIAINNGRDWYYKNTYKGNEADKGITNWGFDANGNAIRGEDGTMSPAYAKTWYGRIWNNNDFKEFDPNNPKFTPPVQKPGQSVALPPQFQKGGKTNIPIYVNDPNDPRLQMYSDSLYNSNLTKNISPIGYNLQKTDLVSSTPVKPTSVGTAIYPNNVHGNMKPSHWDNYVTGVGFDKNSPEYSVARFTPPTQPYILQLQDHAQEQINMPIMGNVNSNQQMSQPINNIPTVIPPPKDYVTIKTGSSYRNPETGAFEQKSFKIDKVTGKRISEDTFKNGGKTKKSSWEIIEDSDELDEYKNGGKTSAWQRKEGKSPSGGLNAKGRASLKKEGHDIKPPQPEGGSRKDSFCARMSGMKKKLTGSKKANDPNSRINLSLKKWKC